MLGSTKLKPFAEIDPDPPRTLNPDGIKRIRIKRLRNVFPKQHLRLAKNHEAAKYSPAKRPNLHHAREHVPGKLRTRRVLPPKIPGMSPANVGINLIVR